MSKLYVSLNTPENYKRDAALLADEIEAFLYGQGEYSNHRKDSTLPQFLQVLRNTNRQEMTKYIEKALYTHEREDIILYMKNVRSKSKHILEDYLRTNNCHTAAKMLSKDIQKLDMLIEAVEYYRHAYEPKTNGSVFDILISEIKKEYLHRVGTQFDNAIYEMERLAKRLEPEAERLKEAIRKEAVDEFFERICKSGYTFEDPDPMGIGVCIALTDIEIVADRMKNNEPETILVEEADDHDR